ncbi:MAG: hypothetical protein Q4B82_02140 [Alysiella sp.]|uniref:hypothetical protein n=1 Tax=Alysiella sp. TaxID=1872483 RepID=UPI0026DC6C21|nr:hypothetical protein [Alysiella sp.]MDO4433364.1 hypothetical protein [Alysiella sp.]
MKLCLLAWLPLASATVLVGCASSPASEFISSLPESNTGSMADLNTYNGKTHVFFTVQNKNVEIDVLQSKIECSDVEALYLPNKYNEQQNIRNECMTLQNKSPRYEPCYHTLGLRHLQEKSIFVKGNVSAGGVLSSIISAPFQVVGAAVNAVTLNGKGVADNLKGIGKGTMDYSTDAQVVQKVGRYLDDRLAQAQKNARQALTNYHDESSIKQAKNIKGLLRDDEYYQAFVNAKNNEQRLAVFNIIGVINGHGDKFDNFTRMVLKSPKDLPLWAETLSATLYKQRLSLTQAKRIPNFASEANMQDFFNSNEYRYVLQYLKPEKITHSASGR